jgi:hypothetical protein
MSDRLLLFLPGRISYLSDNGSYNFPSQEEVLRAIRRRARSDYEDSINQGRPALFLCGSYTIGKERVWLAVADELKKVREEQLEKRGGLGVHSLGRTSLPPVKVYTDKRPLIKCMNDQTMLDWLGNRKEECCVHVVDMRLVDAGKGNRKVSQSFLKMH